MTRPTWWEPWIPARCANGHPQIEGQVSLHRCDCVDKVHHLVRCEVPGCDAPWAQPDDCVGG